MPVEIPTQLKTGKLFLSLFQTMLKSYYKSKKKKKAKKSESTDAQLEEQTNNKLLIYSGKCCNLTFFSK